MRKILPVIALCMLTQTLFSQQGPLLQKFKYRIDHYRAVDLNLNGNGYFDQSNLAGGNISNRSSSGNLGAAWYSIKSTDRILLATTARFGVAFSGAKSNGTSSENSNTGFAVSPYVSVLNKWYRKNMFTELGATGSSNNRYDKFAQTGSPDSKYKAGYYDFAISIGIGKGRLENITDMQNALWLYKELQEAKLLSRSLSEEELLQLGQTITQGNNTRVLDTRRRTQFILKTADDYFQTKALLQKTDINYFSRLNDILFFAVNNQRSAGTEKYIRFISSVNGDSRKRNYNLADKDEQKNANWSLVFSAGFGKYVPVSLTHQNNYGASIQLAAFSKEFTDKVFTGGTITSETKVKGALKQAGVNVFYQHAIYPNTRTIILFDLQSQAGYQHFGDESQLYGNVKALATMSYFISYRTRLIAIAGAYWQRNMYQPNQYFTLLPTGFSLNTSFGLEVSL